MTAQRSSSRNTVAASQVVSKQLSECVEEEFMSYHCIRKDENKIAHMKKDFFIFHSFQDRFQVMVILSLMSRYGLYRAPEDDFLRPNL